MPLVLQQGAEPFRPVPGEKFCMSCSSDVKRLFVALDSLNTCFLSSRCLVSSRSQHCISSRTICPHRSGCRQKGSNQSRGRQDGSGGTHAIPLWSVVAGVAHSRAGGDGAKETGRRSSAETRDRTEATAASFPSDFASMYRIFDTVVYYVRSVQKGRKRRS